MGRNSDPRDCRCLRCCYALKRERIVEAHVGNKSTEPIPPWPPPADLPPCPWASRLTEGDLFPALYLP
jgi:hypothetical protein